MKVLYPWKMVGRYADDEEIEVGGFDEEDCMTRLISMIDEHGDLVWYSGGAGQDQGTGYDRAWRICKRYLQAE